MSLIQKDIDRLIKDIQDYYTLMGTTLCNEKQQENENIGLSPCTGCISRVPCVLKNVLKEISDFNLIMSQLIGKNISIREVSPHLILLVDLLLVKKGANV